MRRDQTVVMAARRAGEVGGAVAHERAGNDAAHAVFAGQQLPRCAQISYSFSTGTMASFAAIWNTLSAEV